MLFFSPDVPLVLEANRNNWCRRRTGSDAVLVVCQLLSEAESLPAPRCSSPGSGTVFISSPTWSLFKWRFLGFPVTWTTRTTQCCNYHQSKHPHWRFTSCLFFFPFFFFRNILRFFCGVWLSADVLNCCVGPLDSVNVSVFGEKKEYFFLSFFLSSPRDQQYSQLLWLLMRDGPHPRHINLIYYCSCSILQQPPHPFSYLLPAPEDVAPCTSFPEDTSKRSNAALGLKKKERTERKKERGKQPRDWGTFPISHLWRE